MTLSLSSYTVGGNQPLNHARILWQPITGTVTGSGTNPALAANDLTAQRWAAAAGLSDWTLTAGSTVALDTVFIAAHNLSGKTFRAQIGGPSRTNLFQRSEELNNAYWTRSNITVTSDIAVAPDGLTTADRITDTVDGAAVAHNHFRNIGAASSGVWYVLSRFVKAGTAEGCDLILGGPAYSGINRTVVFTFSTGLIAVSGAGTIGGVIPLSNGWFRIWVACQTTAAGDLWTSHQVRNASTNFYQGDGTRNFLSWGAQVEIGTAPSGYIPTTSAAVTSDWNDLASWITPADNETIAILSNNAGAPWSTTKLRLLVSDGTGVTVGIIRAGVALQMERPFFGGHGPLNWNRTTEAEPQMTEGGQWVGQIVRRISQRATYDWAHLSQAWYEANFEPFARTLPNRPFGIVGNPSRLAGADVGWCWTGQDVAPQLMGIRDLVSVSLPVTGYAG